MDNTNPFSAIFNGSDPNVNSQLRQRIALAMMAKQRRYPKTFGEGLSAIGDSLGEIGMARRLEQQDLDQQKAAGAYGAPAAAAENLQAPQSRQMSAIPAGSVEDAPNTTSAAPAPGDLPPTGEPGNTGATTFPPPYQPSPGAAPTGLPPPIMAEQPAAPAPTALAAGEDPRRAIALAMLKQGKLGQPQQSAFAPASPSAGGAAAQPPVPAIPDPSVGTVQEDPRRAVALNMLRQGAPTPPVVASDRPPSVDPVALPPTQPSQQQQIRQAPPPAPPAYAMPRPVAPTPAPISAEERKLQIDAQSNPYLTPRLLAVQAARTALDARNIEEYKANLTHYNSVDLKGRDFNANMPKTQAEIAHLNAQTSKSKVDEQAARLQETAGKMVMGPDGVYRKPVIEGADPNAMPTAKLNETQAKEVKYITQMHLMGEQLKGKEKILADGFKDEMAGKAPFVGNALMSRQYRMAKTAAETWIAANLRDISGATIGTKEHSDQMRMLMPKYGDTDEDITRKAQARASIERGMYAGLGTDEARAVADHAKRQNIQELQATRNAINAEMHKHFPNTPKGTTKINKKTGKTRVFDGENWLEAD